MGKQMTVSDTLVSNLSTFGREFGWVVENFRDGLLAGADWSQIGLVFADLQEDQHYVAWRTIADRGVGMNKATLTGPYSGIGGTGTTTDYALSVTQTGDKVDIVSTLTDITVEEAEALRWGLGGRISLIRWNPTGVVTVTINKGVALMVTMYMPYGESCPMMREWNVNGVKESARPLFVEEEFITDLDIRADREWVLNMLSRGWQPEADPEAALTEAITAGSWLNNPLAGVDWHDVVPSNLVDTWGDDGLAYFDGELAQGTVKVLLGTNLTHSTAWTGDDRWNREATTAMRTALNRTFVTTDHDPQILTMTGTSKRVNFTPTVAKKVYQLEDLRKKTKGWRDASLSIRHHGEIRNAAIYGNTNRGIIPEFRSNPHYETVVDLGDYGAVWIGVRDEVLADENRATGKIGMVYNSEIHWGEGLSTRLLNMGIKVRKERDRRMTVLFFPPKEVSVDGKLVTPGIRQTIHRDNVEWTSRSTLPWTEMCVAFKNDTSAEKLALMAHLAKELGADSADEVTVELDPKDYEFVESLHDAVGHLKGAKKKDKIPEGIADGKPGIPAQINPTGKQGRPPKERNNDPRPLCPLCGQMPHAMTCPRRSKGGGTGGKGGVFPAGPIVATGGIPGRVSKRVGEDITKQEPIPPRPPKITFLPAKDWGADTEHVIRYTSPSLDDAKLGSSGDLDVNWDHRLISGVVQTAVDASKRKLDKVDTRDQSEKVLRKVLTRITLGQLALSHRPGATVLDPHDQRLSWENLTADMEKATTWTRLVSSAMLFIRDDLEHVFRYETAAA